MEEVKIPLPSTHATPCSPSDKDHFLKQQYFETGDMEIPPHLLDKVVQFGETYVRPEHLVKSKPLDDGYSRLCAAACAFHIPEGSEVELVNPLSLRYNLEVIQAAGGIIRNLAIHNPASEPLSAGFFKIARMWTTPTLTAHHRHRNSTGTFTMGRHSDSERTHIIKWGNFGLSLFRHPSNIAHHVIQNASAWFTSVHGIEETPDNQRNANAGHAPQQQAIGYSVICAFGRSPAQARNILDQGQGKDRYGQVRQQETWKDQNDMIQDVASRPLIIPGPSTQRTL